MTDCPFQPRLHAYYDDQLSPAERQVVEGHIAACKYCAGHLRFLRSLAAIRVPAQGSSELDIDALMRLHEAVEAAMDADEAESYPISLYRTAAALSAVAASILILSAVWLNELPAPGRGTPRGGTAIAAGEVPAWERVAINLRADPLPDQPFGEVYLADARLADWMLEGLAGDTGNPREDHP